MTMELTDLPASEFLVLSASAQTLASKLRAYIGKGEEFTHYDIIEGAMRSGRLLFTARVIETAVAFPSPKLPLDMARELLRFSPEARYVRPRPAGAKEGWELRATLIEGCPAVIAWASWVI